MAADPHAPSGTERAAPKNNDDRVVAFIGPSIRGLELVTGADWHSLRDLQREGVIDLWQGRNGAGPYVVTGASWRR
jgi:hypothetical protein